jgi:hypothetical protein
MSTAMPARVYASRRDVYVAEQMIADELLDEQIYVSTMATAWPSAIMSSSLTSIALIFPDAVDVTGISIFMASTNAISSPSPMLLPDATESAHTRPATSVMIVISGMPLSGTV